MVIQFLRIIVAFIGVLMGILTLMGIVFVFAVGLRYLLEKLMDRGGEKE